MKYGTRVEIGKRLREFRENSGDKKITEEELGDFIGEDRSFISAVEIGDKSLSPMVLFQLEIKYNLNHNWLLYGIGSMKNEEGLARRFQKAINGRVQSIKEKENLTVEEFAKELGVTKDEVIKWGKGEYTLSVDNILSMCSNRNLNPDWILYGSESNILY